MATLGKDWSLPCCSCLPWGTAPLRLDAWCRCCSGYLWLVAVQAPRVGLVSSRKKSMNTGYFQMTSSREPASSGVMSQKKKIFFFGGGAILRGSIATERGEGVGGGCLPPTVGSFFIFRLENVQSGAYLRRKFRLDDMYYMGKRVTIRPTGKRVFFFMNSET